MNIQIKLNGVKVSREIPTSWQEVTFKQLLGINEAGNDFCKQISVFVGIEPEIIRKAQIVNVEQVIAALSFLYITPEIKEVPKKILGYAVPTDLGFETIGQFEDIKESLKKTGIEHYPVICAVYACKEKHGEYDWKLAEAMAEEFMNAPALEVLAVGNFTMVKFIGLTSSINHNFRKPLTLLKKLKLALKAFRILLVSTVRYYILRKRQGISATK